MTEADKDKKWSWHDEDSKESIVFSTSQGVAVYTNVNGEIVIRQEGYLGEDDSIVVIPRAQAEHVILAIRNELDAPH